LLAQRGYADAAGLSKSDIEGRVMEVMKTFEKVDGGKVGSWVGFGWLCGGMIVFRQSRTDRRGVIGSRGSVSVCL
jgi:hypothetical protein